MGVSRARAVVRPSLAPALALALALALFVGGAGCFGPSGSPVKVTPYVKLNDAEPGRGTEFAFFVESTLAFKQTLGLRAADMPANWTFDPEVHDLTVPGDKTTSLVVRTTPDRNAVFGP